MENELLEALSTAMSDFEEAADRVLLYRSKLLPSAREALEVTEAKYSAGEAPILDVIDSERTLLELQRIYWRAVGDAQSRLVEMQTLVGDE